MKVPKRENKAILICPHCSKDIVNTEQLDKVMKTILKAQTELHKKEKEAIFKELEEQFGEDLTLVQYDLEIVKEKYLKDEVKQ